MYARYAKLRDERGYCDGSVAREIGISPNTLYDWKQRTERNGEKADIATPTLIAIADLFGVTLDELVRED